MHFMNPVPLMQLVELARGMHTSHQTFEVAKGLAEHLGKQVRSWAAGQRASGCLLPPPAVEGLLLLRVRAPAPCASRAQQPPCRRPSAHTSHTAPAARRCA
jgi:hypothetical protein